MKNIIVENKKREYIADIIKSICEKYRFNKVNNDELSKVTGKVYSLDSKLIIKSDSDILIKDAEVISLVYQICNLLNIDALIKINIGSIKYDKLKEYNDVKLGEGCKSHASIDLEKVIKEIEDNGTNIPVEENIDVLFTATSENELETASYLMQNLRLNGFITEIGDKLSAKFNIILKDKDLEHNEVIIKDNVTGEETKSNINDIVEYLEMNI